MLMNVEKIQYRMNPQLQETRRRCAIQNAKYWDVKLEDGETPVASDSETMLCRLHTGDGFLVEVELGRRCFYVHVTLPEGFHHEDLDNWDMYDGTLEFSISKHKYSWCYRDDYYVDLFRPGWAQELHPGQKTAGPVQMLDDARGFIGELRAKKHTGPTDTFYKNLEYMKHKYGAPDTDWEVRLEEGDIMVAPDCTHDRSIILKTVEGFMVKIGWSLKRRSLVATIVLPRNSLHLTSCRDVGLSRKPDACGAAQLLEEARGIIKDVMRKNADIARTKKCEIVSMLREELMIKACHPKRITAWADQGFEPF